MCTQSTYTYAHTFTTQHIIMYTPKTCRSSTAPIHKPPDVYKFHTHQHMSTLIRYHLLYFVFQIVVLSFFYLCKANICHMTQFSGKLGQIKSQILHVCCFREHAKTHLHEHGIIKVQLPDFLSLSLKGSR